MSFQEHVLRSALERISRKDPCPTKNPAFCEYGREYDGDTPRHVPCMGCIARAALEAFDKETVNA